MLCPLNASDDRRSQGERAADLRTALKALLPILQQHGLIGLVEPLGSEESALLTKRAAIDAIDAADGAAHFKVLHDTFHHFLAGEQELFPDRTGLVHISGVEDTSLAMNAIRDAHRVLVGPADRMDNAGQIKALRAGGYTGPLSFEPFAPSVHTLSDPARALRDSISFVTREAAIAA